jgi:alpha-glucosidase
VMRHASRFTADGDDPARIAKLALTVLSTLRGSICLYQGEELGLPEAELAFEDLRDPYGIRFWPGFKGRDGCRTPMAWEAEAANAGFSTGKPWLPVPEDHRKRAADIQASDQASVLSRYRAVLALRKRHQSLVRGSIKFLDSAEDVLAFVREGTSEKLLCVFNFAQDERRWTLPGGVLVFDEIELPGRNARLDGAAIKLSPLGSYLGRVL